MYMYHCHIRNTLLYEKIDGKNGTLFLQARPGYGKTTMERPVAFDDAPSLLVQAINFWPNLVRLMRKELSTIRYRGSGSCGRRSKTRFRS